MQIDHIPVMKEEVLSFLIPTSPEPVMIDCTTGEGGHSEAFLQKYPGLTLYGLDRDESIRAKAIERLSVFGDRFHSVPCWFDEYLASAPDDFADMILFDLGISVFHYVESGRGFSFRKDEKLDMRLDASQSVSAETIVNEYPEKELADLIYKYSEERFSRRIAHRICCERSKARIETSAQLAEIVSQSVPSSYRYGRIHPATRTFQALRIEVNGELDRITPALEQTTRVLKAGGRMAIITFHSLEDRIVKWFLKGRQADGQLRILTKHPVVAGEEEDRLNPPSRSAKLRVAEKVFEGKENDNEKEIHA